MARLVKGLAMILFTVLICAIVKIGVDFAVEYSALDIIVNWFR